MNDRERLTVIEENKEELDCTDQFALVRLKQLLGKDDHFKEHGHITRMDRASVLNTIWNRNEKKMPFVFGFNPETKIPEVFANKLAFMIWCAWRSKHILGSHQDLNNSCLEIVKFFKEELSRTAINPSFSDEEKKKIINKWCWMMQIHNHESELGYWSESIFPLLSWDMKFKYVVREN